MIKKLLLIFTCAIVLNANNLDEKIIHLIGNQKYIENKGLIKYLFFFYYDFYDVNENIK